MERIKRFIRELSEQQWLEVQELRDWEILSSVYQLPGQYDKLQPYKEGGNYNLFPSVQGTTYFFRRTLEIPVNWLPGHTGLIFASGGEGLLRVNGESRQGLDRNHTFVTLAGDPSGRPLDLEIELFDPVPEPGGSIKSTGGDPAADSADPQPAGAGEQTCAESNVHGSSDSRFSNSAA